MALQVYSQIYNTSVAAIGGATALNYTSPVLHNVRLTGLTPNTQYFYQAGDGTNFSPVFNFTSMQTAGGPPWHCQQSSFCTAPLERSSSVHVGCPQQPVGRDTTFRAK